MSLNEQNPATKDLVTELAISRLQGSMERNFAQVQGKLDMLVAADERMNADVAALEVRVSALERRVYVASGAAALLGMAVPVVTQLLAR